MEGLPPNPNRQPFHFFQRSAALNNSEHVQDDEDDSDNEQGVDPAARLREAWADVPAEVTKQPEDY
jgi:hypothetical protein